MIGVDWGSSTLRVFDLSTESPKLIERAPAGLKRFSSHGDLDTHVVATIERFAPQDTTVVMCGMVTSAQGWRETSYVSTPARLEDLARAATITEVAGRPVVLAPGVRHRSPSGMEVMRGEETQLVGLDVDVENDDTVVVMPGTHSKWVTLRGQEISDFATYVTGEMFELIATHSLLGALIEGDHVDLDSFDLGARVGAESTVDGGGLLNSLFSVRTRGLFDRSARTGLHSYLSGLLIGAEIGAASSCGQRTMILGDDHLARSYKRAFATLGRPIESAADAEVATGVGLRRIAQLAGSR